ncbi:MAG TPA: class I adenylate-forming enzyme family protein [Pseudolabrys sp.]|nr:class I adenylate-forming enzyme family protein [Pseudolabrys sp.]
MILGDEKTIESARTRTTLDNLFRRAAVRRPRAVALADPPDRSRATDGDARRLTYADADDLISAVAARLRGLGLSTDVVVALQLPNTIESVITLLGVMRAGMIAALVPLLWRKADIVQALNRIHAKAFITTSRIGTVAHGELAMQAAADLFSIRHVCVFGEAPDGTVPFDEVFRAGSQERPRTDRAGNPADHVAVITFDVTANGIVPVARNHAQLIAAGLAPLLEGRIAPDATILTTTLIGSMAGTVLSVMPWLLSGGTLALHHPFDGDSFAAQWRALRCEAVVLPAPLLPALVEVGQRPENIKTIFALWRGPERLATAARWDGAASLVDVVAFGEIGLVAAQRREDGLPRDIPFGKIATPLGRHDAFPVLEAGRSKTGTLLLRGPITPQSAFPPGAEQRHEPIFKVSADGFIDTGYGCTTTTDGRSLAISSPPAGFVGVGGYRLAMQEVDAVVARTTPGATLIAVPHAMVGQRLAGAAADPATAATELLERGENPLIAAAFRSTRAPAAA